MGLAFNIVRYNAGATSGREVRGHTMKRSQYMAPKKFVESFWQDPARVRHELCQTGLT